VRDEAFSRVLRGAQRNGRLPAVVAGVFRAGELLWSEAIGLADVEAIERETHTDELAPLWEEMTMVRRSAPAGAQW